MAVSASQGSETTKAASTATAIISGRRQAGDIFRFLNENVGKVVPRSRIENSLYAWDESVESNSLDVHIHNLRRKLGADCIRTVRGVGYTIDSAP